MAHCWSYGQGVKAFGLWGSDARGFRVWEFGETVNAGKRAHRWLGPWTGILELQVLGMFGPLLGGTRRPFAYAGLVSAAITPMLP